MSIVTITLNPCIDKTFAVERVMPERKLEGRDVERFPGGGGINVARVATRLGAEVKALWSCGGDTGRALSELLDAEGVAHEPISIRGSVRENVIVRDVSCNQQYRFGMPGPELTRAEHHRWLEGVERQTAASDYLVLSGSRPPGVPTAWLGELVRAAPGRTRVIVDTKKDSLREALAAGVHMIKPNVRELEELVNHELGGEDEIEAAARDLINGGSVAVVLVSLGRGGAMLMTVDQTIRLAAPAVPIRSKVGAGDSMVGGLVAALDRGAPLVDAARLGVAAGAAAVMTRGTLLCHREDVERLTTRVDLWKRAYERELPSESMP